MTRKSPERRGYDPLASGAGVSLRAALPPTRRAVTSLVLPREVTKRRRAYEGGRLRRLRCAAQAGVAPRNSLRSLRELRSDRRGGSEHEARGARRPQPSAARRLRRQPTASRCTGQGKTKGVGVCCGPAAGAHLPSKAPRSAAEAGAVGPACLSDRQGASLQDRPRRRAAQGTPQGRLRRRDFLCLLSLARPVVSG